MDLVDSYSKIFWIFTITAPDYCKASQHLLTFQMVLSHTHISTGCDKWLGETKNTLTCMFEGMSIFIDTFGKAELAVIACEI